MYLFAAKANMQIKNKELSYEYSKKALELNKTHTTYYIAAVTAYNQKNYQEALDNINNAIAIKPADSEPDVSIYNEIKERSQNHLKIS